MKSFLRGLLIAAAVSLATSLSPAVMAKKGAAPAAESARKADAGARKAKPVRRKARPARKYAQRIARMGMLKSSAVLVLDAASGKVLYQKNARRVMPIASVTKLMTALVVLESGLNLREKLTVSDADVDRLKYSSSRLRVGTRLSRNDMLHIALMSSENRAASALGRHYPGGKAAFVRAMNARARALGMKRTRFVEPTGLSSANVSSPEDLAKLTMAAQRQPLIRRFSTDKLHVVAQGRSSTTYRNSNRLIAGGKWRIGIQKTGYISEAGRCMVLHATVGGRAVVMVFLDAHGKFARAQDAARVRTWLAQHAQPRS
ncbi:D-alanyl-D-alanine endopeptidase [Massilia sp. PAMC28688]|uniref:D-alanyl-D-alanine endopeptidase n=1 Tax=Massilia sp. PAMC28688 TaxID=2861283 RepID=UPI001C631D06|nr:D-alanyl-D-alanine endopeptidase [Massilia sp. PAMC28688]QYF92610.1 D-alanyl-D-alanine endopeptidase [Massilia sp. PAMC28688]